MDVPKPKAFKGARSASEVDNFLWAMESTDVRCGGTEIRTWEEFQKEFKAQFYLEYTKNEAREKLWLLTYRGTVREYMQEFKSLVELDLKRDRFESSKPNGKGNGGYHEEDEKGHSYYGSNSGSNGDNGKP
ncbi:hypothetical protein J1N35_033789 [Gossypium stocksii]|uniref:Retrotransposon gag domain-containing protein n=1 Tax=Gossypium stocksii TaxID=47602 RepID=A0A9D3URP5_9ROSI|nr:hypothetical protein J1N35_033789 [Gossypium stocksii]